MHDRVDNPITTRGIREAPDGPRPAPHLPEAAFDDIGRAELDPLRDGAVQERQQFLEITRQTGDGLRGDGTPLLRPAPEPSHRLPSRRGGVDRLRLRQTGDLDPTR